MKNALMNKIESYHFECEDGPLHHCKEWIELRRNIAGLTNALRDENLLRLGYHFRRSVPIESTAHLFLDAK